MAVGMLASLAQLQLLADCLALDLRRRLGFEGQRVQPSSQLLLQGIVDQAMPRHWQLAREGVRNDFHPASAA
jgi:hypothetical protein